MMNAWNDLIKTEPNIAGMGGGGGVGLVVQPGSNPTLGNSNVNSMYDNDSNLMSSQNGPAAVAAAVATAAMMISSSNMPQVPNGYSNSSNGMMMNGHGDDCNLEDDDNTMDNDDDDCNSSVNNDAEGVWSPDIEQSFQEALAIYPPCGRRKIILSEEGKMYGRNELIARYIKVRTGKSRSRKQVSSHIQVLAKRKTKDFHNHLKDGVKDGKLGSNGAFPNPFSHLTSAQIISPAPVPLPPQQSHIIANNTPTTQTQLMTNPNMTPNIPPVVSLNPATNLPNTPQQLVINPRNNQNSHHQSQLLQNCTNLLPNTNSNGIQSQTCIWSHPGLQPEKKARTLNMPSSSSLPSSTSSSNSNEDLIASSSSSSSSQNNENNRNLNHHHHHVPHTNHHSHHAHSQQPQLHNTTTNSNHHITSLSPPDSLSPQNQWITGYNNNNLVSNKCISGLQQLRLIEFSGFIEQRHDPELYHKHLFVHLNTSDYSLFNKNDKPNETDDFETINYKEFADKFPENDLFWSLSTNNEKPSSSSTSSSSSSAATSSSPNSAAYLIKFWVDLNYSLEDGLNSIYAVTNIFESPEPITISCSTKVCSFGNQVVEKVETEHGRYESNGKYVYRIEGSPMCEYMITFINKLKQLPEKSLQNSVLENFSVLQLIKNHDTQELLLSLAYVFEVSTSEHGAQHVVYKLSNK